jgi:hypothetical protein
MPENLSSFAEEGEDDASLTHPKSYLVYDNRSYKNPIC